MNVLLIERYTQFIEELMLHTDDILRAVVSDDKIRQDIKYEWYTEAEDPDSEFWDAVIAAEEASYTFDPSIYPDNFFNE